MYRPWSPLESVRVQLADRPFPQLAWSVQGRSVLIHWTETFGPATCFDIAFDNGLAGLIAVDESTYASVRSYGLPAPDQFDAPDFTPLPWPVWREVNSGRAKLYGDLGGLSYTALDSYWFSGGNVVLLIDVADCMPRITVV
jgi:hypothetical protein